MKFTDKNGVFYFVIRTNEKAKNGAEIFRFTAWDDRGGMVNSGEVAAKTPEEAREKILCSGRRQNSPKANSERMAAKIKKFFSRFFKRSRVIVYYFGKKYTFKTFAAALKFQYK